MSWTSFSNWVQAIPLPLQWAMALLAVALGLPCILWPERIVRGLRRWLQRQLRWVRSPAYRRFLKIYGWLLFVTGVLLMLLLAVRPGR